MLRLQLRLSIAAMLVALFLAPPLVLAQDDNRSFPDTGFTISDDAVWNFFNQYGGVHTFGEPVSREFTLLGHKQLRHNSFRTPPWPCSMMVRCKPCSSLARACSRTLALAD